jgi:hypothetical protein
MHVPGRILHLLRLRKHAVDVPTWLLRGLCGLGGLWPLGARIGAVLAALFCFPCRRARFEYAPRWDGGEVGGGSGDGAGGGGGGTSARASRQVLSLDTLLISPHMISDHMPDKLERVLRAVEDGREDGEE